MTVAGVLLALLLLAVGTTPSIAALQRIEGPEDDGRVSEGWTREARRLHERRR